MMKSLQHGIAVAILAVPCFAEPAFGFEDGLPVDPPVDSPVTRAGERLAPELLGPGYVETMDVAVAREAARREAAAERERPDDVTHGSWYVPPMRATRFPHSGNHNVIN